MRLNVNIVNRSIVSNALMIGGEQRMSNMMFIIRCPNRCTGEFEIKQPHKVIKAQISALKFICKNNKYGCTE